MAPSTPETSRGSGVISSDIHTQGRSHPRTGRYAPSPTGRLHLGNLRTALVAWLDARSAGAPFLLRFEDLDTNTVREEHYASQAEDLRALGLDWDGEPIRQTDRMDLYRDAISDLRAAGQLYPCYCSRREIREAAAAPNGPLSPLDYPGTCRELTEAQRRSKEDEGRPPAYRLRVPTGTVRSFDDDFCGHHEGPIDDVVLQRNDGAPAYNLVVVIDDDQQGVGHVIRADDLLTSTPRQLYIAELLGVAPFTYGHVPLVLGPEGKRLAKRDGSVTLPDRIERGETTGQILSFIASTLGLCDVNDSMTADDLVARFKNGRTVPKEPLTLRASYLN